MLGLYPGIDAVLPHFLRKLFLTQLGKLRARHGLALIFDDAKLHRNGNRRIPVVSRDHDGADARPLALLNRAQHFRADGIYHAGQADERHALLEICRFKAARSLLISPHRRAQHSESLARHGLIGRQNLLPRLLGQREHLALLQIGITAADDFIRRAFGILQKSAVLLGMHGAHHLAHTVEGCLADPGLFLHKLALFQAQRGGITDQRGLCRLARGLAVCPKLRIRAERHGAGQQLLILCIMLDDGHLVLRQRARLVAADDLRAP